jgi:hypothetical protein
MSDTEQIEQGEQSAPEYTEVEQKAMELGWKPKEEFQGDVTHWKSAEVFLALEEPIKRIENQSREVKQLKQQLAAFQEHYSKVQKTEYERAVKTLQAERKAAFNEGDFDKVTAIEDEIDQVKETAKESAQVVQETAEQAQINPEFANWVSRNEWYVSTPHMKTFADLEGNKFARMGLTPTEVLKRVEQEVRKEFPNKFTNPNREKPSNTEGTTNRGTGRSKEADLELNEQERSIMNTLVRGGHITKEKYISDLKKAKGI